MNNPRPPTVAQRVAALEAQVQALNAQVASQAQAQTAMTAAMSDLARRVSVLEAAQPFQFAS